MSPACTAEIALSEIAIGSLCQVVFGVSNFSRHMSCKDKVSLDLWILVALERASTVRRKQVRVRVASEMTAAQRKFSSGRKNDIATKWPSS